jgi:A/G-specific adenine glycosylase
MRAEVGEPGAHGEELALDRLEHGVEIAGAERRARRAETGVQLVDVAVGLDRGCDFGTATCRRATSRPNRPSLCRSARVKLYGLMPAPPCPTRHATVVQAQLLSWYRVNGRSLPWRTTSDPYHILVSEVMLQQTQVDRVLPKYHEWLAKYPSFEALAAADANDVSATWRPLGYNIRPKRLHAIARESVARFGGQLPSDHETLLSFKGSARTRRARSAASPSASARRSSTPTWRACSFACSWPGRPKAHAMRAISGSCPRRWCPTSTSSTSTRA